MSVCKEPMRKEVNSGTEREGMMTRSSIKEAVARRTFQMMSRNMFSKINPQQIFSYITDITIRLLMVSSDMHERKTNEK